MSLSTRNFYFISGNPHSGNPSNVRKGVIEFDEDIRLDRALTCGLENHPEVATPLAPFTISSSSQILQCIISVPAFMIHEEILNFLSSIIPAVKSISILRHYSDQDQYFVILLMDSLASSQALVHDYHGRVLSSLQPTTCMIYSIKNIYFLNDDLTQLPIRIRGLDQISPGLVLEIRAAAVEEVEEALVPEIEGRNDDEQELSEEVCAICLYPILADIPNCLTTCCNHTFHISCLIPLESSQCPVCRFEHDSTTFLSSCSVCSVISPTSHLNDPNDTWVCLVCGFVGCGPRGMNHSQQHYQNHLHAYAMNTETKRVWDYAGEGYVHRLILSRPDTVDSSDLSLTPLALTHQSSGESKEVAVSDIPRAKIVEVSDPRGPMDGHRPQYPPLTPLQEDYLVSRKLESAAEHYSGILAWQLEQQRQYFESQLSKLRSFADYERSSGKADKDLSQQHQQRGGGWLHRIEQSLLQERLNLMKQKETAESRLQRVEKEISLLEDFNSNLEANSEQWVEKAESAAKHLQDVEGSYRNSVAILERKIRVLMQTIDQESTTNEEKVEAEASQER